MSALYGDLNHFIFSIYSELMYESIGSMMDIVGVCV